MIGLIKLYYIDMYHNLGHFTLQLLDNRRFSSSLPPIIGRQVYMRLHAANCTPSLVSNIHTRGRILGKFPNALVGRQGKDGALRARA